MKSCKPPAWQSLALHGGLGGMELFSMLPLVHRLVLGPRFGCAGRVGLGWMKTLFMSSDWTSSMGRLVQ